MPKINANFEEVTLAGPWHGQRVDLSETKLCCSEKSFVCDLVLKKHFKAAKVAEFFSLNNNTVRSWIHIYKKGRKLLLSRDGRSRRLDSESIGRIYDMLEKNISWNRYNLYEIIREECLLSWHRMHEMETGAHISADLLRKMKISRRSLTRYADGFLEKRLQIGLE